MACGGAAFDCLRTDESPGVSLHEASETGLERRRRFGEFVSVEGQGGLETQRVARPEPGGYHTGVASGIQ